ncbi:MAG TPA: SRPBCC family protein [Steroidobacteraceae bacterium]
MSTPFTSSPGLDRSQSVPPKDVAEADWYGTEAEYEEYEEYGVTPMLEPRQLTQALGWFSVVLGLTELIAPRALGRAIGVGEQPALIRLCGVREIVTGIGMLSERYPSKWAMARVAGDAIDLALLGAATRLPDANRARIALTASAVASVTALDVFASRQLESVESTHAPVETVAKAITINSPPETLYRFWRNLENFPRFMRHLDEVRMTGERTSHWVAKAPAGTRVEWDAEIVEDEANSRIAWRTLPGSSIEHEGVVSFEPAPGGRGTIVRVSMSYVPPAGKVGVHVAKLLGEEPGVQIDGDLRRMKQLIETGEIATTDGQPSGRRSVLGRTILGRWLS